MKLRLKKYPKGFIVEIKKRHWLGFSYWTHYTHAAGLKTIPWYSKTPELAIMSAVDEFKESIEFGKWGNQSI